MLICLYVSNLRIFEKDMLLKRKGKKSFIKLAQFANVICNNLTG